MKLYQLKIEKVYVIILKKGYKMKKQLIAISFGVAIILTGCGNKPTTPTCQIDGANAPNWVCDGGVNMKGGIFAVGSAEKSPLGFNFQREEAMTAARDEIAREISLKVKNMIKTYMSSTGTSDNQTAERVVTSVSKQLASQVLRGSKLLKTWISPKGTMYVLVGIKGDIKEMTKQAVRTTFKNDEALWQEFKSKKAQEELDAAIDKEFK